MFTNNKDIKLLRVSEKESLRRFLILYIFLVSMLLILLSIFYYKEQEKLMFSNARTILSAYATTQTKSLKILHYYFPVQNKYPRGKEFKSGIYDIDKKKIFSLLEIENINFSKEIYRIGNKIHFLRFLDNYYLGTRYLFIEINEDKEWQKITIFNIIIADLISLFVLAIFGIFFMKLFLRPMKNSIILLDHFIKDTTHELNTPISVILANIETIDLSLIKGKNSLKLSRINIAIKTIYHIYQDLTYLTLGHITQSDNVDVDIKKLIYDRIEYFSMPLKNKGISIELFLENLIFNIDIIKITRVIDNIISNAIKYNKKNGNILIILKSNYLIIKDSGIGIKESQINFIFDRYSRFNNSQGGFGIGLNIVKSILNEYKIEIIIKSKLQKWTEVKIIF